MGSLDTPRWKELHRKPEANIYDFGFQVFSWKESMFPFPVWDRLSFGKCLHLPGVKKGLRLIPHC